MRLPSTFRPRNSSYREFKAGIDLPSWFVDDLKSIDSKLYIVWHPYKVIWDSVMNQYEGLLVDPRFTIHREYGEENWGFVTTNGRGAPLPDRSWHIWRLCEPHGWAHVLQIESKESGYLSLLARRLHLQGRFRDRYGDIAWNKKVRADQEQAQVDALAAKQELFDAVQDENKWLMRRAMENFERGIVKPTNPQKEIISSYAGQKNRSRIIRPLDDEDVKLVGFNDS